MTRDHRGSYDGRDLRIGIVVSRFNEAIGRRLLDGALDCLTTHGVADNDIAVVWVPGAFEIPIAAKRLSASREVDAVVCLGAVIRGETAHFDYVAGEAARGVAEIALSTGVPATFGVLTTDTTEQAKERSGGTHGNKGFDAALAAIDMANVLAALPKPETEL